MSGYSMSGYSMSGYILARDSGMEGVVDMEEWIGVRYLVAESDNL